MKRAAIYARFSSDRQNERSARDQVDLCRAWAERQGDIVIVAEYRDEAVSGASTINRLELGRMMRDARERVFDVVLCEALDRLSRDQADLASIRKQLNFLEVGISTVQDGEVGAMHIGLKGLMGELYLADLAQKTRRGLRARVNAGASGGGRSYGYEPVEGKPGEQRIVEREAAIVRRIFDEYVAGATPRRIVAGLNREGIPGPRGGKWNASAVNGSRERLNGILQNRLYVGEIVWNRQRFVKNPATGKRVSRLNPENEWLRAAAAELAIVDRKTFDAAQAIKASKGGKHSWQSRRPRHLLSGLLHCAECGAGYTVVGRNRLGCSGYKERGDCSNGETIARAELEGRVLKALSERLGDPMLVGEYLRAYHDERRRLAKQGQAQRGEKQRRLDDLTRAISKALDQFLFGDAPKELMTRVKAMEEEAESLRAELAALDTDEAPVQLHPAAGRKYAAMVADLQGHVAGMKQGVPADAVIAEVRKLIARIDIGRSPSNLPLLSRKSKEPATITVRGLLAELLLASGGPMPQGIVGCGDPILPIPYVDFAA